MRVKYEWWFFDDLLGRRAMSEYMSKILLCNSWAFLYLFFQKLSFFENHPIRSKSWLICTTPRSMLNMLRLWSYYFFIFSKRYHKYLYSFYLMSTIFLRSRLNISYLSFFIWQQQSHKTLAISVFFINCKRKLWLHPWLLCFFFFNFAIIVVHVFLL